MTTLEQRLSKAITDTKDRAQWEAAVVALLKKREAMTADEVSARLGLYPTYARSLLRGLRKRGAAVALPVTRGPWLWSVKR